MNPSAHRVTLASLALERVTFILSAISINIQRLPKHATYLENGLGRTHWIPDLPRATSMLSDVLLQPHDELLAVLLQKLTAQLDILDQQLAPAP